MDSDEEQQPRAAQPPSNKRFLLQVDRQTKSSFDTLDDARAAGVRIKQDYPVVEVAILDGESDEGRVVLATPEGVAPLR